MQKYLGILSSDSLNRDGTVITFEALESGIAESALKGMPSLVDHDFHRPLGWIFPFGILIEPKISKTVGSFNICESSEDTALIHPKIQNYWQYVNYSSCKDHIDEFKMLLGENFSAEGQFIHKGAVSYSLQGITSKIFPKLFSNTDKSGLVYLDELLADFEYAGMGIFKSRSGDFCLFCHQFFSRNLSLLNNFNTYFIDEFMRLHSNKEIKLRIAIDPDLIGLSKSLSGFLEHDWWWGPKFNDDISSLPNEVTRYQSSEEQKLYNCILGTEFWWKTDDGEKTLEIEEIRERPSYGLGKDVYGCRYIHSIYDNEKKEFNHFDGAVRVYSEDQILDRWEININKAGKNTDYTKLFRIDGKLELSDWKKLCILYYKGNPLLFEYFGAKEEYDNLQNPAESLDGTAKYLPGRIEVQDGIRLFASYHHKEHEYGTFERKIIHPDRITSKNGDSVNVLEYDIIEIEKCLKRKGGKIDYPDDTSFIKPFDFYTNYPIIVHGSENTPILVQDTLEAFKSIFKIQNKSMNKTIAFSIGWEMQDFEMRLSVFGKSSEIANWLESFDAIPADYENFRTWLAGQRKWIYSNYEYQEKDYSHLLKDDGIFYINRKIIDHEMISFPDENDQNLFEISTSADQNLQKFIEDGSVLPSYAGIIKKASCSRTGLNYLTSSTSKYLDDDVKMNIEKIELATFFWTDQQNF